MRLKQKVYRANDDQLGGHFILDKILHNRFIISDTVLNRNDVQIIFILRNPEDTAKSIINMGSRLTRGRETLWYLDLEKVLSYYITRLKQLEKYGLTKRSQAVYLDAENLIENNNNVLEFLTKQLHLNQKLRETYDTFKYTGLPGHGDPSDRIKEGKINTQKNIYSTIQISKEKLLQAEEVYRECRNTLLSCCISVDTNFGSLRKSGCQKEEHYRNL